MKLDNQDSLNLSATGIYEPYQTFVVKQLIRPGYTVLDIGANIGYYTLIFSKLVGEQGHVIAFEPEPDTFTLLAENVARNDYANVVLFQKAVSDKNGTMQLFTDAFSNLDHRLYPSSDFKEKSIAVDVVQLDNLAALKDTRINLVKMDIQGAECAALKGMSELVSDSLDLILITEFWPSGLEKFGTSPKEFTDLLDNFGFSIYEIIEKAAKIVSVTSLSQLLASCSNRPFYTNLVCVKGSIAINSLTKLTIFDG